LVIRKVNHVLALQDAAANESETKSTFAKRDIFSTRKIVDHLMLHLETTVTKSSDSSSGTRDSNQSTHLSPASQTQTQAQTQAQGSQHPTPVSLYADEHVKTVPQSSPTSACVTDSVSPEGEINDLVSGLPTVLTSLLTQSLTIASNKLGGATRGFLFEVVVKTISRKLFYAGQVCSTVSFSCPAVLVTLYDIII
jgi:hypothetical protein